MQDEADVQAVIKAVLTELGRTDTPYAYGVAVDGETGEQIIYFDLPRISPLQFNVGVGASVTREQLVATIKKAVARAAQR